MARILIDFALLRRLYLNLDKLLDTIFTVLLSSFLLLGAIYPLFNKTLKYLIFVMSATV